jgi:hypothetical protein
MSRRNKQPFWKPQPSQSTSPYLAPRVDSVINVMVAVFTGVERTGWVNPSLTTTLMRLSYDPRIRMSYVPVHAVHPVCQARNMAVDDFFLKSDSDVLVLFDNDVAPPHNIADAIVSMPAECDVAVMPYWVWLPSEQHTMPCFGRWEDDTMVIPDPSTLQPGWQKMGAGGTGCMFIRKKVFTSPDKLTGPFFKIISTEKRGQIVSEDIYFTGLAANAGFPTWVNTDFICSHFHTVDLMEVNQGTVRILDKFTRTLQEKYGDHGIQLGSLIQEMHPELLQAQKKEKSEMREARQEKHSPIPTSEWK